MELNETFLKSYFPKNRMFTSIMEIDKVNKNLLKSGKQIDELDTSEMQEVRNSVVKFYDPFIIREDDFKYMSSMQSVTAVIDFFIYQ